MGVAVAGVLLPCSAWAGANSGKPNDAPADPGIERQAAPAKRTLPPVTEIATRTSRPQPRDFDLERWRVPTTQVFYLTAAMNTGWTPPHSGTQRYDAPGAAGVDTSLMELRWKFWGAHRSVPTFELAGCDVISPRDFYAAPQVTPAAAADPHHAGRLQRARRMVSEKISGFMHSGCD
jgi:hypothetical protein